VLVGPSGCGKTTVLRMIAGLEDASAGEIHIGDRRVDDLEPAERDIAMVFQSYALYPHMTVRENLSFGLRTRRTPAAEIERKLRWAAEVLQLGELLERRPAQLSGGQKQRVAFGRAVVREPKVFLFDEPLSNLDARLRADMRGEVALLHERLGTTMIYVTHDQVEAMTLGQRIAVLCAGALQQYAPPLEVYREPANLFVAGFIGTPAINTVAGEVRIDGGDCVFEAAGMRVSLPKPVAAGPATLGVRPEGLALGDPAASDASCRGIVRRIEPLGSELLVHVDGPGGAPWVARLAPDAGVQPGQTVSLFLDRSRLHLFGPDGHRLRPA
jgi:ABC-type sugar transport system ATPase subunit